MKITKFTDLTTWKECHKLVLAIYKCTQDFPSNERFGLILQMRRAGVSVTSNIAEGFGRRTKADKKRFYNIAEGSLFELQNQLIISRDLSIIDNGVFENIFKQSISALQLIRGSIRALKINT